jgi:predicted acyltransferase
VLVGLDLGLSICPTIKRLWTPSWALLSGGYCLWMLGSLYLVIDVLGLRFWTLPVAVVGMNSILVYIIDMTLKGPIAAGLQKHISPALFDGDYGPMKKSAWTLAAVWLLCAWLYRQKAFLRL